MQLCSATPNSQHGPVLVLARSDDCCRTLADEERTSRLGRVWERKNGEGEIWSEMMGTDIADQRYTCVFARRHRPYLPYLNSVCGIPPDGSCLQIPSALPAFAFLLFPPSLSPFPRPPCRRRCPSRRFSPTLLSAE